MSFPEARIDLTLRAEAGRVAAVTVRSSRLTRASRMLAGRRPEEVTALLQAIFSLCGTAQALAGARAMEAATGQVCSPAHDNARKTLLLAEITTEHALGMARDWPGLLGEDPALADVKPLRSRLLSIKALLYPNGDWTRPGGGRLAPHFDDLIAVTAAAKEDLATLLGADPAAVIASPSHLADWASEGRSAAARLIHRAHNPEMAGFGTVPFTPMPADGPPDIADRLSADNDGRYGAQPDHLGVVYETGPLARRRQHPLLAELRVRHGAGLLTRLASRLVETTEALRDLAAVVQTLRSADPAPLPERSGSGVGLVEAARGLLAHRVELEGGRVSRYQILAPTEWNFHPAGPLVGGLMGSAVTPDLAERTSALVTALDPCVASTVRME